MFHLTESRIRSGFSSPHDLKRYLFQYGSVDPVFPAPSPGSAVEQEAAARTHLMWLGIDRLAERIAGARISPEILEHSRKRTLRYVASLVEALRYNDQYHDPLDAGTGAHYLHPNAFQYLRLEENGDSLPVVRALLTTIDWHQGRFVGFRYLSGQNNGVFEHNLLGNLSLLEVLDRK